MIRTPPAYGYLEIDPPLSPDEKSMNLGNSKDSQFQDQSFDVSIFDQSIINEGRLHYIQSISNQSLDSFIFDVTNGISELNELTFHLTILPKTLYIETRDLVVTEGKSTKLLPANLHVLTSYYEDKIEDYLIVDPPTSGQLVFNGGKENKRKRKNDGQQVKFKTVNIFSIDDLDKGLIEVFSSDRTKLENSSNLVTQRFFNGLRFLRISLF